MFEPTEYQQRISLLQQRTREQGLDAFIVRTDAHVRYLTGVNFISMERPVIVVVPATGDSSLIVPRMEKEQLSTAVSVNKVIVYWEVDALPGRGWKEMLFDTLGAAQRIGIEPLVEADMTVALAGYQWQVCPILEDMRVIKSPAEVAWTRRIAHHWTDIMNAILKRVKAGVTLGELMAVASEANQKIIGNEPAANFLNTRSIQLYQTAPESGSPHHFAFRADDVLPNGPTVINAVGAIAHYNAENERTILTGNYSQQHAELFDLMQQGQQLALDLIKPGVPCAEVDLALQHFFAKEGVTEYLRCRTGHGFGIEPHERPNTSEGSEEVYQPNMIISVEPGLYVDGVGGFRHSDTVLITEDGIENFTTGTPKDRASLTF